MPGHIPTVCLHHHQPTCPPREAGNCIGHCDLHQGRGCSQLWMGVQQAWSSFQGIFSLEFFSLPNLHNPRRHCLAPLVFETSEESEHPVFLPSTSTHCLIKKLGIKKESKDVLGRTSIPLSFPEEPMRQHLSDAHKLSDTSCPSLAPNFLLDRSYLLLLGPLMPWLSSCKGSRTVPRARGYFTYS